MTVLLASSGTLLFGSDLPVARASASIYDGVMHLCSVVADNATSCGGAGASATADAANGGGGMALFTVGGDSNVTGSSDAFYYIEVDGPPGNLVPIDIAGSVDIQNAGVDAAFLLTTYDDRITLVDKVFKPGDSGPFLFQVTIAANAPFAVSLGAGGSGGFFGSALIDPKITIDPSYPLASEYTLASSPGVFGPASGAVPEPASIWLITALLPLAAVCRRRYDSGDPSPFSRS